MNQTKKETTGFKIKGRKKAATFRQKDNEGKKIMRKKEEMKMKKELREKQKEENLKIKWKKDNKNYIDKKKR